MQTMKQLFQGKRKFISIPVLGILALAFFPIAIGLGLGYLVYKKVGNPKIKYIVLAIIALFTLSSGSAWVAGMSSPKKPETEVKQVANVQTAIATPTVESSVTPISTSAPKVAEAKKAAVAENRQEAKVVKVIDGDTLDVSLNGKTERIRIIGIDTPETVDPRKPVQCFGQKASDMAKEQLSNQTVQLESDPTQGERDKYGRLLRYIWLDDGSSDFGAIMIQYGYAHEYTYNIPYKYQTKYKQLQKDAEAGKKGLWADDACAGTTSTTKSTTSTSQNTGTTSTSSGGDKDCSDFSTQAEAQTYFNSKGGSATNNVDRLDGNDHDGKVCESLP
jgi:micrococcal nuclease